MISNKWDAHGDADARHEEAPSVRKAPASGVAGDIDLHFVSPHRLPRLVKFKRHDAELSGELIHEFRFVCRSKHTLRDFLDSLRHPFHVRTKRVRQVSAGKEVIV